MTEPNSQTETTVGVSSPDNRRCVELPARIGAAIERRLSATDFDTTDEYVAFAMESLLRELDQQTELADIDAADPEESEQPPQLEDRLESLGYL
jgi:hypothetical protein